MKCEICGKKATYRFSPDMDIKGLGACRKHKRDMQYAYIILVSTKDAKQYEDFIKALKNKK